MEALAAPLCLKCGSEYAPDRLACPSCGALVHAARLKALVAEAEAAGVAGDVDTAIARWDEALALLPLGTRQHEVISAKLARLRPAGSAPTAAARAPAADVPPPDTLIGRWIRRAGPLGALALLLWKLKALAFGATKLTMWLSLFASFAVYWSLWGWRFAAGFLGGLYVHELGHVVALRRRGIRASAPMFIPGLGAFVRMHEYPRSAADEARVGLAGPLWGLGATAAFFLARHVTGNPLFAALTITGAQLNLFNLTPVWQLDGARALHALSKPQRWLVAAAFLGALVVTGDRFIYLPLIFAVLRAFGRDAPARGDSGALGQFLVIIAGLAALAAATATPAAAP
jgi:Zn-dependent protease